MTGSIIDRRESNICEFCVFEFASPSFDGNETVRRFAAEWIVAGNWVKLLIRKKPFRIAKVADRVSVSSPVGCSTIPLDPVLSTNANTSSLPAKFSLDSPPPPIPMFVSY